MGKQKIPYIWYMDQRIKSMTVIQLITVNRVINIDKICILLIPMVD